MQIEIILASCKLQQTYNGSFESSSSASVLCRSDTLTSLQSVDPEGAGCAACQGARAAFLDPVEQLAATKSGFAEVFHQSNDLRFGK